MRGLGNLWTGGTEKKLQVGFPRTATYDTIACRITFHSSYAHQALGTCLTPFGSIEVGFGLDFVSTSKAHKVIGSCRTRVLGTLSLNSPAILRKGAPHVSGEGEKAMQSLRLVSGREMPRQPRCERVEPLSSRAYHWVSAPWP